MNTLKELEEIRKKKEEFEKLEKEALKPVLTDFDNISLIYEWFKDLTSRVENFATNTSTQNRQYFVFIILLLYAPGSVLGDKMPNGLRNILAKVLELNSEEQISHNSKNVMFMYNTYREFRSCADYLYSEILFRIELNNLK